MRFPHQQEERRLRSRGYRLIAGVDEAGRGALAGPMVGAAVILPKNHRIKGIKDSKKIPPSKRKKLFIQITQKAIAWSWYKISSRQIDKRGIQEANRRVLKRAVQKLEIKPDYFLVDAVKIKIGRIPSKSFIKGDERILSIAAASIVAKVIRDELMIKYHQRYPQYSFHRHKGYGTRLHFRAIKRLGPSAIHRQSFNLAT